MAGILFIISAPSGSGKSTLVNQLRSLTSDLEFSISYTTRSPRGSEQDGREYHFTTREKFQQMVAGGEFLEWADVFGNFYGTARHSLLDAERRGKDLLLDIDVQGAAQVREAIPDAVSIFVMPPDPEILATRLRNRSRAEGSLSEETIHRRLAQARHEIENYERYRYIIVNDVLDRAVEELAAIVAAERMRHAHHPDGPKVPVPPPQTSTYATEYASTEAFRTLEIASRCLQSNARERLRPVLSSFGLTTTAAVHV